MLATEPMPVGWKPCRYACHNPAAPPDAGISAPPPSVPGPSSDRSATSATMVSPANSSTPGLVSTRCASPLSTSIESSSVGSSDA